MLSPGAADCEDAGTGAWTVVHSASLLLINGCNFVSLLIVYFLFEKQPLKDWHILKQFHVERNLTLCMHQRAWKRPENIGLRTRDTLWRHLFKEALKNRNSDLFRVST